MVKCRVLTRFKKIVWMLLCLGCVLTPWDNAAYAGESLGSLFTSYGNVMQIGLPVFAGVTALSNDMQEQQGLQDTALFLRRFTFLDAMLNVTKFSTHEARPAPFESNHLSFPSGHTTAAFSGAAFLSRYHFSSMLKCSYYALAGLVGLSRITSHHHHVQDVLAGAILGSSVMLLPNSDENHLDVLASSDGLGLGYEMDF